MSKFIAAVAVAAATASLTACGGASTTTARDCFAAWNESSNHTRLAIVAARFTIGDVSPWIAEAAGAGNVGGSPSHGCGYLFHTTRRYLSISGEWSDRTLHWGTPPTIQGAWSARQQASVHDDATVGSDGLLRRH